MPGHRGERPESSQCLRFEGFKGGRPRLAGKAGGIGGYRAGVLRHAGEKAGESPQGRYRKVQPVRYLPQAGLPCHTEQKRAGVYRADAMRGGYLHDLRTAMPAESDIRVKKDCFKWRKWIF